MSRHLSPMPGSQKLALLLCVLSLMISVTLAEKHVFREDVAGGARAAMLPDGVDPGDYAVRICVEGDAERPYDTGLYIHFETWPHATDWPERLFLAPAPEVGGWVACAVQELTVLKKQDRVYGRVSGGGKLGYVTFRDVVGESRGVGRADTLTEDVIIEIVRADKAGSDLPDRVLLKPAPGL